MVRRLTRLIHLESSLSAGIQLGNKLKVNVDDVDFDLDDDDNVYVIIQL